VALTGCVGSRPPRIETAAMQRCRRATARPKIDGVVDRAWQRATLIDGFLVPGTGAPAQSHTVARLLWDNTNLYICYEASDLDVWSHHREHDSATYEEDVLEVFLKPGPNSDQYCNFEINALGTVYDAAIQREGFPMGPRWKAWNCEGLQVGIRVLGSLNDGGDQDQGWVMEVAIPFASLPFCKGRPPVPGDEWLFHLGRYDYSLYLPTGCELSSCAPLTRPSFHNAKEWLRLRFE